MNRLEHLETIIRELEKDTEPSQKVLTRKELSSLLSCSERFLVDHPGFKSIEYRFGNKVYYDWADVRKLIFNKSGDKE